MSAAEKKERIAFFCGNAEIGRLAEHLTFTEPYLESPKNRWTTPELDELAGAIRQDDALKRAVSAIKQSFMAEPQALIHGNLHTGSVLVTETDTKVIDPVCAFFGPIGFDLGTLIGHLLIGYFSQPGHAPSHAPRSAYEGWLAAPSSRSGTGSTTASSVSGAAPMPAMPIPRRCSPARAGRNPCASPRKEYMRRIFEDTLRFAGTTIIRATLGRHHVADFEQIEDRRRRAACERPAVLLARELIKDAHYVSDMAEVMEVARQLRRRARCRPADPARRCAAAGPDDQWASWIVTRVHCCAILVRPGLAARNRLKSLSPPALP